MSWMQDRLLRWLAGIGVVALVAGVVLASGVLDRFGDDQPELRTTRFESAKGGFAVDVPEGLTARREGRTGRFTSTDRRLVVTVGPSGPAGSNARQATRQLLDRLRATYPRLRVTGRQQGEVNGRASRTTAGVVRTEQGVDLRFVVLVLAARPRCYAMTAFAAADTDPQQVVPRVNEIADSFEIVR